MADKVTTTTREDLERERFVRDSKGNTAVRTIKSNQNNTFEAIATVITTTATLISIPPGVSEIFIRHIDNKTVYIGADNTIIAGGTNVFPIEEEIPLRIDNLDPNGDVNIFGIVANTTATIYVLGVHRT